MSDNWVVQNLENALATWNEKLAEIWQLITQSPETFKGGTIWNVVLLIHDTMQAIGLALLVLFFVVGVVKTCGSFAEIKRPEAAVKLFIRFALAKAVVTYGLELMMALFSIAQGAVSTIMDASGLTAMSDTALPDEMVAIIEDVVTAGTAVRESIELFKHVAKVNMKALIVSVDRMERGTRECSTLDELRKEYGIAVHPIVTVRDIIQFLYERPIDGKVYIDHAMKERMEAYLRQYGAE